MRRTLYRARLVPAGLSTDDIIPARYKHMHTDPSKLAPHVLENRFPGFAATFAEGDALVCNGLFGIGSSREQAVSALSAAGIRAVLAPDFGRIFFRNAWNLGLAAIETDTGGFTEGAMFRLDLEASMLQTSADVTRSFARPDPRMIAMLEAGGLLPYLKSLKPRSQST